MIKIHRRRKNEEKIERISITINSKLLDRINKFLKDDGLKEDKVNRSLFIQDILSSAFEEFDKEGENSIIGRDYPLERN